MLRPLRLIAHDPILRLSALGTLIFGSYAASIGPYQSLIAVETFGLSQGAYAAVLIGALIIGVAAAIGIGIVTDQRPSRRQMAMMAAIANIAGGLLVWLLPAKASFIFAHVVLLPIGGSVFGQIFAVARLASQRLPEADRPGVLAVLRACFAVPFVLVLPVWGFAADHGMPLQDIYPGLAVMGALHLILILRDWPRDRDAPWTEVKSGLGFRAALAEMTSGPVLLRVQLVGIFQAGGSLAGILIGLSFAAAGRPTSEIGLFFALLCIFEVAVTLMLGRLAMALDRLTLITSGVLLYAVFLIGLPLLADSPLVWGMAFFAGAGGALFYTLAISYLQDLLGRRAGAGASLIALQAVGREVTSATSFWIGTMISGYAAAGLIGALATVAAVIGVVLLDRQRRPVAI